MFSPSLRFLLLGLVPIALTACVEIEPATGSRIATAPLVGTDLGGSGRVPQIAGLAGEGEGYGRTEPNPLPGGHGATDHGATDHGATGHAPMDPEAMGHGSRHGMAHGSTDHASLPAMRRGSRDKMVSAQVSPGMKRGSGGGGTQTAHSGHAHVQGTGTVNSVDAANRKVNVTHAPIPTIGWPSMTMDFAVAPAVDLNAVKPGIRIKFDMEQGQGGMYVIQSITPAGGGR